MKVKDILNEVPLPQDWDKDVYSAGSSFKKQIDYAMKKAERLGQGSSRVAFEIPYKGRPTVLKIAKNKKGLAQNEVESMLLEDYILQQSGIVIPLIDYDEENDPPKWIHVEKADKMTKPLFRKFMGGLTENELNALLKWYTGALSTDFLSKEESEKFEYLLENNDTIEQLAYIISNYDLPMDDLTYHKNWGIYKGKPVIVDIGLTHEVYNTHYR